MRPSVAVASALLSTVAILPCVCASAGLSVCVMCVFLHYSVCVPILIKTKCTEGIRDEVNSD